MPLSQTFNFAAEAGRAFNNFPHIAKTTAFVDASVTPATFFVMPGKLTSPLLKTKKDKIEEDINYAATKGRSLVVSFHDANDGVLNMMIMKKNGRLSADLDPQGKFGDIVNYFVFDHELAHVIVPARVAPLSECMADAHGALRILQRDKKTGIAFLKALSAFRAYRVIVNENHAYMTTSVIDRILDDSTRVDFSTLNATQTMITASQYAREYAPRESDARQVLTELNAHDCATFDKQDSQEKLLQCLQTSTLRTADALSFRIGARALQHMLGAALTQDLHQRANDPGHAQRVADLKKISARLRPPA